MLSSIVGLVACNEQRGPDMGGFSVPLVEMDLRLCNWPRRVMLLRVDILWKVALKRPPHTADSAHATERCGTLDRGNLQERGWGKPQSPKGEMIPALNWHSAVN